MPKYGHRDTWCVSQVWHEHELVGHITAALRDMVRAPRNAVGSLRRRSRVLFGLRALQRHLERLLSMEESEGYLHAVAVDKPNLSHRIDRLQNDHQALRRRVEELVPAVDRLEETQHQQLDAVCSQIDSLLHEVERHDHAEIKLLQDLMLDDEGGEG